MKPIIVDTVPVHGAHAQNVEITNGKARTDHYNSEADIARRIASYCEGDARIHVYAAALDSLKDLSIQVESANYMREISKELGYPSILEALEDISNLREKLEFCISVLCSVRKNYEEESGLWEDVNRAITEGNYALIQGEN